MKILGKVLLLLVMGLLTVGVIYPLLHEGGHALAALCVGGEVREIRLFPTASVLCRIPHGDGCIAVVGMAGTLLPAVVAVVLPHRRFGGWLVRYILLSVCLVTLAVPPLAVGMGHPLPGEDLAQICVGAPHLTGLCCGVFAVAWTGVALLWVGARPLAHWRTFLQPSRPKGTMHK